MASENEGPYDSRMHTVGVAPGTITMQLGQCPADPPWQYFTPPYPGYGMKRPVAAAGPTVKPIETTFEPYGTESKLMGLRAADPLATRWDIVAMAAGGTLLAAVVLAAIATR
jgi:hypothetical protein